MYLQFLKHLFDLVLNGATSVPIICLHLQVKNSANGSLNTNNKYRTFFTKPLVPLRSFLAGWIYLHYCCSLLWRAISSVHNVYSRKFVAYLYRLHTVVIFAVADLQAVILHEIRVFGLSLHQTPSVELQCPSDFAIKRDLNNVFLIPSYFFCHTSYNICIIFWCEPVFKYHKASGPIFGSASKLRVCTVLILLVVEN